VSYPKSMPKPMQASTWWSSFFFSLITHLSFSDCSITDIWANLISYHFLNGTTRSNFFTNDSAHGAGLLWSDIPNTAPFQDSSIPYPLVIVDSEPVMTNHLGAPPLSSVVYEVDMLFGQSLDVADPFLRSRLMKWAPSILNYQP
jgi:hypothetical protein